MDVMVVKKFLPCKKCLLYPHHQQDRCKVVYEKTFSSGWKVKKCRFLKDYVIGRVIDPNLKVGAFAWYFSN